jgi:hypothetical protein
MWGYLSIFVMFNKNHLKEEENPQKLMQESKWHQEKKKLT